MSEAMRRPFQVSGHVTGERGEAVACVPVMVWWQRMRDRAPLGKGETDDRGAYSIDYAAPDSARPVQIVVEALRPKAPLASPPTAASAALVIDLAAPRADASELALLQDAIAPELGKLTLVQLEESPEHPDLTYLGRELNRSPEDLMRLAVAARLGARYPDVPLAAWWAFLRQRVPSTLPGSLLDASKQFTAIESLLRDLAAAIVALPADAQTHALTAAVAANLVAPLPIGDVVTHLQSRRHDDALSLPFGTGATGLGALLDVAKIPAAQQSTIAAALVDGDGSDAMWARLVEQGLTQAQIDATRHTLELGALVGNSVPLITALAGTPLPELAKKSVADWQVLIGKTPGAPAAADIAAGVANAYPAIAFSVRTAQIGADEAIRAPLATFLGQSPALDLRAANLDAFAAKNPAALAGIKEQDAVLSAARRVQRVLRITPDVATATALLGAGFDAAGKIAAAGKNQFLAHAAKAGLAPADAKRLFTIAENRHLAALGLWMRYHEGGIGPAPAAMGNGQPSIELLELIRDEQPTLATLFGDPHDCAVEDCTSILSPAAYLCDLLLWLGHRAGGAPRTALFARRPDLAHLKLSCPNTETPLPYIDLVLELLEDAVSPPAAPTWHQTSDTATAAQLRAAPEHVNDAAYEVLATASYPWQLPYDRGADELRTDLAQSGVQLWQLRRALAPLGGASVEQRAAAAAERFQICAHEQALILGTAAVAPAVIWNTRAPATDLARVDAFLAASSLSYAELLQIVAVEWIAAADALPPIRIDGVDDSCDPADQTLANLSDARLARIHRFVRLYRRTGWQMWELDQLLRAPLVGAGTLDAAALAQLGDVRLLQDATHLPVDALLAWFQPIGATLGAPALPAAETVAAHAGELRAWLQLGPADLATLAAFADDTLSPATLSFLFRGASIARATGVAIGNLAWLLRLPPHAAGAAPFAFASLADAQAFIDLAAAIGGAGFTLDQARAVLTPRAALSDADIASALGTLRAAIQQVMTDVAGAGDPPMTVLGRELGKLPAFGDAALLAMALAIVDGTTPLSAGDQAAFLAAQLPFVAPGTLAGSLPADPAARQAAVDARATAVLGALAGTLAQQAVIAAVAANRAVDAEAARAILSLSFGGARLLDTLTDRVLIARVDGTYLELTRAGFGPQFDAYMLVAKVALVVHALALTPADLSWLLAHHADVGGLDLANLPIAAGEQQPTALLVTTKLVQLDRAWSAGAGLDPPDLFSLIAAPFTDDATAQAALAGITGWRGEDIAAFATALDGHGRDAYTSLAFFEAMQTLAGMAAASGGTGADLVRWGAPAPSLDVANGAFLALRSRYSPSDWLAVAPKRMDPLRERRSAALSAYLVVQVDGAGHPVFGKTQDELFSYFLIDTQTSALDTTTRVVQAYAAVQLFVQRCRMNLEVDITTDADWDAWQWMDRYRVWEANREVFLYPENWLVEAQRPTASELATQLQQQIAQAPSTAEHLETCVQTYLDGLDAIAHLVVTGMCTDPETGDLHLIARTPSDPPRYFVRTRRGTHWGGWIDTKLHIPAHQVAPVVYARRLHLFWLQIATVPEAQQTVPAMQPTTAPGANRPVAKHLELAIQFSALRNGAWQAPQASTTLYDVPLLPPDVYGMPLELEAQYTIKAAIVGSMLQLDIFRLGTRVADANRAVAALQQAFDDALRNPSSSPAQVAAARNELYRTGLAYLTGWHAPEAGNLARALFDGRFHSLQLQNRGVVVNGDADRLLDRAQRLYGADARLLSPLATPLPNLRGLAPLEHEAGALVTAPIGASPVVPFGPLPAPAGVRADGVVLATAAAPYRVVIPTTSYELDPTQPFVFQDGQRAYFVSSRIVGRRGLRFLDLDFARAYHPYSGLFWHQLSSQGFAGLYDPAVQETPDTIDPSLVFDFTAAYQPGAQVAFGENNEIVTFAPDAPYGLYNWELFFHVPLYVADQLTGNQQFEDALGWLGYIFDPTTSSFEASPQRYWRTKPFRALASGDVAAEEIEQILTDVAVGDPDAETAVAAWRADPFDPYAIADQRNVAYMKRTVMSYLDTLIAWGDNLFSSDSREALNEATLLYVRAKEILGPDPQPVVPPKHADASFAELLPRLDEFANAFVAIENYVPPSGGARPPSGPLPSVPPGETFYFKIPPNAKLLAYWATVEDRLFKLRHSQNLAGQTRSLALFDAPIDPGLLVRARAAGVDLGSVLSDVAATVPPYRFATMLAQAQDFVGAVRAYATQLLAALEQRDSDRLSVMVLAAARDLARAADDAFARRIDEAQAAIDAAQKGKELATHKQQTFARLMANPLSPYEITEIAMAGTAIAAKVIGGGMKLAASGAAIAPNGNGGCTGAGGSPTATLEHGGSHFSEMFSKAAEGLILAGEAIEKGTEMVKRGGEFDRRFAEWRDASEEAGLEVEQADIQIAGLGLALDAARLDRAQNAAAIAQFEQQLDFWTTRVTSVELYDWLAGQLAAIYFQSYRLAYEMAKRAERAFRFELGLTTSAYMQFGYWDSTKQGLLAGEALDRDLRRMQAAYVQQNVRRFEISRNVSLKALDAAAFANLLAHGSCEFSLPEALWDRDYPGHYQRRIYRVSVTVDYPAPGRTDNVRSTLTLLDSSVRLVPDISSGYARRPTTDPRFTDQFGAVQSIVTGNAQDDAGLFVTDLASNAADPRYLPFEGAGAISTWRLDLPIAANADWPRATVTDVQLRVLYTALDGGGALAAAAAG